MNRIIRYSIVLTFAISFFHLQGQIRQINFDRISIEQGLSQSAVECVIQDDLGFIWMGTQEGINKYDGKKFTVYLHDQKDTTTVSSNSIWTFYKGVDGRVWIGTDGGGLCYFDHDLEIFYSFKHDPNVATSISNNNVKSIIQDEDGRLWLGTDRGLNHFNPQNGKSVVYLSNDRIENSLTHDIVRGLFKDKGGRIWAGTYGGGLSIFNPKNKSFMNHRYDPGNESGLISDFINCIYEDKKGGLWFGTLDGLSYLSPQKQGSLDFIHYRHDPNDPASLGHNDVRAVFEDSRGNIWIGSDGGGLSLFLPRRQEFTHYKYDPNDPTSLSEDRVQAIYEDAAGVMWVGTWTGGVNKFDGHKKKFDLHQNEPGLSTSIIDNGIYALFDDRQGYLWVGTVKGLNRFDHQTKQVVDLFQHDPNNLNSLTSNRIWSIFENPDEAGSVIWVGTNKGVNRLDYRNGEVKRFQYDPNVPGSLSNDRVFSVFVDSKKQTWVGTDGGGLNLYDPITETFKSYRYNPNAYGSLGDDNVTCIVEDRNGVLWIGTRNSGLSKLNRGADTFRTYQHNPDDDNSIISNKVWSMYVDKQNNLWVGTESGISKIEFNEDGQDTYTHFTQATGLANNWIYGMHEDDHGNLWLSSNQGITKLNMSTGETNSYESSDGLQSNEFNLASSKNSGGYMSFGGINGLNIFHPDSIRDNPYLPPVRITGFQIFNQDIPIGKKNGRKILDQSITKSSDVTLSYKDNVFSFEFAALHYVSPENNQYMYMMEGFDEQWNKVGNRNFATYTNLSAGDYTFRVRGSNSDGRWNDQEATIAVTIIPPFWKTWWAYMFYAIIIGGTVIGYVRYQKNSKKYLRAKINEATAEIKERNDALRSQQSELEGQRDNLQAAIRDTNFVVKEAVESGNFRARIDLGNKEGEWRELGQSINYLFESVLRPFGKINVIVRAMSNGDLTLRYRGDAKGDVAELTSGLNGALDELSRLLSTISTQVGSIGKSSHEMLMVSEEMNNSTAEIATSIGEMSDGAQNQVSKVDESSSLVEGMLKFSNEMGEQAETINQAAETGVTLSEEGTNLVNRFDGSMKAIMEISDKTEAAFVALTNRSQEITRVLKIIKDIASNTNLLALNAAIEAAQAGDAGRGFAVVAEEIRKLAESSKESTKDIEELVNGIQVDTQMTAKLISEMGESIRVGEEASGQTADAFQKIAESYQQTFELSKRIVDATQHQAADIGNIVNITENIVVIAEQTAAGTNEISASAEELSSGMSNYIDKSRNVSSIVEELKEKVAEFKLNDQLSNGQTADHSSGYDSVGSSFNDH